MRFMLVVSDIIQFKTPMCVCMYMYMYVCYEKIALSVMCCFTVVECSVPICKKSCPYGYERDENQCQTCECFNPCDVRMSVPRIITSRPSSVLTLVWAPWVSLTKVALKSIVSIFVRLALHWRSLIRYANRSPGVRWGSNPDHLSVLTS